MKKITRITYDVLVISERGNELCSESGFKSEHAALSAVSRILALTPNGHSWEIVKVTREIVRSGNGSPTPREMVSARHR